MRRRAPVIAVAFTLLAASVAPAETVRVLAAASLTEAFREIAAAYERERPGDRVELCFAGSQILRTQIEQGAPADLFASADRAQMDALQSAGLAGQDSLFALNSLVVITPLDAPRVTGLRDLARPGVRLVIAGRNVPAGRYTIEALGRMGQALGTDFEDRAMANVVSQETNVRAVLAKVSFGEVDAGLVYATDTRASRGKVVSLAIPDSLNPRVEYPVAPLTRAAAPLAAARFMALVLSPSGQEILLRHGFEAAR